MRFFKSIYKPINESKYIGNKLPIARSSWERMFMTFLDNHISIIKWASEPVKINYICPFTHKKRIYIPDFIIMYKNSTGIEVVELIEIKPYQQGGFKKTKSRKDALLGVKNTAKWQAAQLWAAQNGMTFRVITEKELFRGK